MVRIPGEYVYNITNGVRRAGRQAIPLLFHPAEGGDECWDDAYLRGTHHHAGDSPIHSRRLRGTMFHWICDWRVVGCGRAENSGGHFYQDRGYRLRPHEDRL